MPHKPVEHIAPKRTHPSAAGQLVRRVSNIFRKQRPSALAISAASSMARIYEARHFSQDSFSDDEDDDDDDIRRPSGLGSAASISSLPPSPFAPSYPTIPDPPSYPIRASSTPNLLRSYSPIPAPRKDHPHPAKPRLSLASVPSEAIALIFSHLSKPDLAQVARTCSLFLSPCRALLYTDVCLDDLSQPQLETLVAMLASRRDFTDLVRTLICHSWPPFFLPTSGPSRSRFSTLFDPSFDPDLQHRNTLLTATFTLAFQRMSHLTTLTLPSYDHDLLAHHTAFGLQNLTFTCSTLSKEEAHELFAWLDGQTNIATLIFPNLVQDTDYGSLVESRPAASAMRSTSVSITTRPSTSNGAQKNNYLVGLSTAKTSTPRLDPLPPPLPPKPTPRPKSALPTSPSYATFAEAFSSSNQISKVPFPSSHTHEARRSISGSALQPYHKPHQHSIFSLTLLPNLKYLHAPPSLVIALASPPTDNNDDSSSNKRPRPLRSVHINITTTLYTGLRPATIMSKLIGVTRRLGLYFGENVDRRSVEKVLGAAGSSLGGVRQHSSLLDDGDRKKRAAGRKDYGVFTFGDGEWRGLVELDVSFAYGGPGSDEKLHKLISSAIPRYPYLRILRLQYLPSSSSSHYSSFSPPSTPAMPDHHHHHQHHLTIPPSSSLSTPTTPTLHHHHHHHQKSQPHLHLTTTNQHYYYPPSPHPSTSPSTITTTSTNSNRAAPVGVRDKDKEELSPPERAYVRQWRKYCRDLEEVVFLGGAEWVRKR